MKCSTELNPISYHFQTFLLKKLQGKDVIGKEKFTLVGSTSINHIIAGQLSSQRLPFAAYPAQATTLNMLQCITENSSLVSQTHSK